MEHKQLKTENGNIHYWIKKNENDCSKCIVFTHGLTADHTMFEQQVKYFSSKCTVITWDVPMHGLSRPYSNFSYKQTAIDLNRILEIENIHEVVLIGMSMGGYPSQMFASLYAKKVKGFVVLFESYTPKSNEWQICTI